MELGTYQRFIDAVTLVHYTFRHRFNHIDTFRQGDGECSPIYLDPEAVIKLRTAFQLFELFVLSQYPAVVLHSILCTSEALGVATGIEDDATLALQVETNHTLDAAHLISAAVDDKHLVAVVNQGDSEVVT